MNIIGRHNTIKSILPCVVEWINVLATLYLISTLVTSFNHQRPALYAYFISVVLDIIVNRRYANVKWQKTKWTFVAMILFYVCVWIWHIFEQCNSEIFFRTTDIRLPFLAFGVLGLCFNRNPQIKIRYIAYTMLVTSIVSIVYIVLKRSDILFATDMTINMLREVLPQIRQELLHVTHIEYNLYLNCTMVMCFICFANCKDRLNRIIFAISTLFIYALLLLNEGRIGFITANILFLLFVVSAIYQYKPKLLLPAIVIFTMVVVAFVNGHDRLNINYISEDPRGTIWKEAYAIIKEKPIVGHGVCCGKQLLIERTTTNPDLNHFWRLWYRLYPNYNKNRFHCHNAFLESAIEFGLIGIIISISIFLLPILLASNRQRLYISLFVLTFAIQAMFESFTSHFQILLFCLILYLFIDISQFHSDKQSDY